MTQVPVLRGSGPLAEVSVTGAVAAGGGFANKQAHKHLVQADLATLNSAPVTLIPAPGTGKIIVPTEYYAIYGFVSTDYSYDANTVIAIRNQTQFAPPAFFIGNGESSYSFGILASNSGINSLLAAFSTSANYPLVLLNQAADDTNGGDGTLDIWINYFVIDENGVIQQ